MSEIRHWRVLPSAGTAVLEAVAAETGLPKARIKHAMNCGSVWLTRRGKPQKRLRRVQAGDIIDVYYDAAILARKPLPALCVADETRYRHPVQAGRPADPGRHEYKANAA